MTLTSRASETGEQGESPEASLQELRVRRGSPAVGSRDLYAELMERLQQRLLADTAPGLDLTNTAAARALLQGRFEQLLAEDNLSLNRRERRRLFEQLMAEILGYGPLERYINMEGVTEIMVNGPQEIYIERGGQLERVAPGFGDEAHLLGVIERLVVPFGQSVSAGALVFNNRLPDGTRVNVVMPPAAPAGPLLTLTLPAKHWYSAEKLIQLGSLTPEVVELLEACVFARLNILVAGGPAAGKTTLLNLLCSFIPDSERIVTVEETAELLLRQEHVLTLEARGAAGANPPVSTSALLQNTLRMRPDRIVVGQLEGAATRDFLHAIAAGYDGCLATIESSDMPGLFERLGSQLRSTNSYRPLPPGRPVASSVHLIIQQERLQDGSRKVTAIHELLGLDGDTIETVTLFVLDRSGVGAGNGLLRATGVRPRFMWKLQEAGITLSPAIFRNGSGGETTA